jgi:type IV pilus assembly protein PilO
MADLNVDLKNIDWKNIKLPKWAQVLIAVIPSAIIVGLVVFLSIMPKNQEIELLRQDIAKQEAEIAKSQSMVARLDELRAENERLKKKLKELEDQLPAESEISSLLKQVSDLGLEAGLKILSWKPATRRNHPSGVVYEIPVSVSMKGSYHRLGQFFASLTRLNRIVNITNIKLGSPKFDGTEVQLSISFSAVTFTAVAEGGISADAVAPKTGTGKKKR